MEIVIIRIHECYSILPEGKYFVKCCANTLARVKLFVGRRIGVCDGEIF
jgi:hypothetical protein